MKIKSLEISKWEGIFIKPISFGKLKFPKYLIWVFIFVSFFLSFLFGYQKFYTNKIYKGIKVAGLSVAFKTKEEAKLLLDQHFKELNNKGLLIEFNGKTQNPKLNELGINFNTEEYINKALGIGKDEDFWKNLLNSTKTLFAKTSVNIKPSVDDKKLDEYFGKIGEGIIKSSSSASFKIENDTLVIESEKKGIAIDKEKFKQEITKMLQNGTLDKIILAKKEIEPDIKEKDLNLFKTEVENLIKEPIVLIAPEKKYYISSEDILSFITFSKKDHKILMGLSDEVIGNFVVFLAKKIDLKPKDREILATNGQVIDEGYDGKVLDQNDAKTKIKNALNSENKTMTLTISEKQRGEKKVYPEEVATGGKFPGKYIEIDLREQKLYTFFGNDLIGAYSVSSGKWSMPTPSGTFSIISKNPRAYSSKYRLYMPYWMQFTGAGHGIHELPEWGSGIKEGASHLGTPVSHGCVRLGVGPAETVYNWVDIGTPVVVHR